MSSLQTTDYNFGNLPPEYADLERSPAVIFPVPYEATTSYRAGTKDGPQAIITASHQVELFDEELLCCPYEVGIATLQPIHIDRRSYETPIEQTRDGVAEILKHGKFPVVLGGEHSLSWGAIAAAREKYPDLTVLQIDAHADLRDEYEGSRFSHACIMRRVVEAGIPTVQVGIRNISEDEYKWLKAEKPNTAIFWGKDLDGDRLVERIPDILGRLWQHVWVTIDLDGFDPSLVPAVGTPEPGGLSWYPVLKLLRSVFAEREVVGCDVVELMPLPGHVSSDFLAAKLVYKLIGYKFCQTES